jgi:succinate dehydrogenase/fumarate reductase cytochrome b subunit
MLKPLQAATGALFALFVFAHLINTWLAAFGAHTYDSVQGMLRQVYQFAPLEVLLLSAAAVHAVIGIVRWVQEPPRTLSPRARWHRRSAVFLLVFIVGHVAAVRGVPMLYDVFPQFAGLAWSMQFAPYYFYPYYFLLGMAGLYHGANGLVIAAGRLGWRLPVSSRGLGSITAVGAVLMILALLSLGGVTRDVGPVHESDFARLGAELFGIER